jgi:chemotaxis signal transduction protein
MAELVQPPGMPPVLAGVLNLAGLAVPAVRLDRLFKLPPQQVGLYSMLVILRDSEERLTAILVDRVRQILTIPKNALLPINGEDCFHACSEATVVVNEEIVCVLSPSRILLEKEWQALTEFQVMAQHRLLDWEVS